MGRHRIENDVKISGVSKDEAWGIVPYGGM